MSLRVRSTSSIKYDKLSESTSMDESHESFSDTESDRILSQIRNKNKEISLIAQSNHTLTLSVKTAFSSF